ncbi:MAG: diacylglycerol kinase family lipid kinase [Ignavibacteriae bacterium]|nr:diacylglycerol kinase family lipid kinase [Ignavibacteriota bacterium]
MTKYLYIVNPTAGMGKGITAKKDIDDFHKKINTPYKITLTESPKHATIIAKDNSNSFSHIIAVGGDGTINEVINGIDQTKDIFFGVLPIGTGNDLIKSMNFPNNLFESLKILHDSEKNKIIFADLGLLEYRDKGSNHINSHYFINGLGIGFDAYVGFINSTNKRFSGVTSYVIAVLKALYKFRMIDSTILFDKKEIVGEKLMLTVGKGISSGGGFYLTPNAVLDDNYLDVSVFDKVSRFRLLQVLPKALINKLHNVSEAKMYKTKSLQITLEEPYYVHCDGEIISYFLKSAEISCIENSIKLIVKK